MGVSTKHELVVELAEWMRSSLPRAWTLTPRKAVNPTAAKVLNFKANVTTPKGQAFTPEFKAALQKMGTSVSDKFGVMVRYAAGKRVSTVEKNEQTTETIPLFKQFAQQPIDLHKALILQASKYLVDLAKKNKHPISPVEISQTASEIVNFLESMSKEVYNRVRRASNDTLTFSQDAQSLAHAPKDTLNIDHPRNDIFRLTQGALRYLDLKKLFDDPILYRQCASKLSEVISNGAKSETSAAGYTAL